MRFTLLQRLRRARLRPGRACRTCARGGVRRRARRASSTRSASRPCATAAPTACASSSAGTATDGKTDRRRRTMRSGACHQPQPLPNLRVTSISTAPGVGQRHEPATWSPCENDGSGADTGIVIVRCAVDGGALARARAAQRWRPVGGQRRDSTARLHHHRARDRGSLARDQGDERDGQRARRRLVPQADSPERRSLMRADSIPVWVSRAFSASANGSEGGRAARAAARRARRSGRRPGRARGRDDARRLHLGGGGAQARRRDPRSASLAARLGAEAPPLLPPAAGARGGRSRRVAEDRPPGARHLHQRPAARRRTSRISSGAWAGTVAFSLLLAVGLFFLLPVGITSLFRALDPELDRVRADREGDPHHDLRRLPVG